MPEAAEVDRLVREGNALEDAGHLARARALYDRAATLDPDNPRPLLNIANVLARQGRPTEAAIQIERAIAMAPEFAPAHYNLGHHFMRTDPPRAAAAFRSALLRDADFIDAKLCLAQVEERMGRKSEALTLLENAVREAPGHPGALQSLGAALLERARLDEAEDLIVRALAVDNGFLPAVRTMAALRFRGRRTRESGDWYRRAIAADPTDIETIGSYLFSLLARDDLSAEDLHLERHRVIGPLQQRVSRMSMPRKPGRTTLRVGYLSPDFRRHAVALFIDPVLRAHDRRSFEIFCYQANEATDDITERLRAIGTTWRDVSCLDDEAALRLMRTDELDVLVDLAGHTAHSRTKLIMHGVAPVQMSWLGYLGPTGLAAIDYRICDSVTDPADDPLRSGAELPLRMPTTQWCYAPMHANAAASAFPTNQGGAKAVTFGSFNQFWKITQTSVRLWSRILLGVPTASLRILDAPAGRAADALVGEFAQQGIDADRIQLTPRGSVDDYFARIAEVDVALDTTPYTGATTTLDALWMGVPIVGLLGATPVSRSSSSILLAAGLRELVTTCEDAYVEANIALANNEPKRAALRGELRRRLEKSPLLAPSEFTRSLETLYRRAAATEPRL